MPFVTSLTLRGGLIAMLTLFAMLMLLIGGGSYLAMKQAQDAFDSVYTLNVERLGTAREVYAELMQVRVLLDSYQVDYNRLRVPQARETWAQAEATFAQARATLDRLPPAGSDGEPGLQARFQTLIDDGIQPAFETLKAWDVSAYQQSAQRANALTAELDASLAALTERSDDNAAAGAATMAKNVERLQVGLPAALLFAAALMLLAFHRLQRHLLGPLAEVRQHLSDIADGNLASRLSPHGVREMSRLKSGVRGMQQALHELVAALQQESRELRDAAARLNGDSQQLTAQSQQQAQALQETTVSMTQIAATVNQTADSAEQGRELAQASRRQLDESGHQVARAIQEMQEAQTRSQASLDVISMIDSLAFQTNLLALNASVEAARAGPQGRGFAVVAEEVRTLSARSAEAARTIRGQIEGTHRQVHQGADGLNRAGETLTAALGASQQLGELLDGIALSCQQQRDGVGQIDQAIAEIDAATQRNVALAERTLDATRDLEARARRQRERAEAFHLATETESLLTNSPAETSATPAIEPARSVLAAS
ncbi:methyl-accepting chemotaxis protein [Salinicola avicenniae]|uniref:methyl-accepting chemotaxis protein n=1 Tax=Salinicola avicenniae TaxID=2916836 RepID=UPI0020745721|nr:MULTISPECIES: methyl-accepting chemotaxis protein [unclassified Salinicola]